MSIVLIFINEVPPHCALENRIFRNYLILQDNEFQTRGPIKLVDLWDTDNLWNTGIMASAACLPGCVRSLALMSEISPISQHI